MANSFDAITIKWLQGLKDATGSMPYAVGGSAKTGIKPVNINSTRDALIQAYPWIKEILKREFPNYKPKIYLVYIIKNEEHYSIHNFDNAICVLQSPTI